MMRQSTGWIPAVKLLLLLVGGAVLASCATVPYEEHYMLRSEYYRSLEEAERRAAAEKDALRERIANLQADLGKDQGRVLQLQDELDRAREDLARQKARLAQVTEEAEQSARMARREMDETLLTIDRLEKELEMAKAAHERNAVSLDTPVVLTREILFDPGTRKLSVTMMAELRRFKPEFLAAAQISLIGYTDDREKKGAGYDSPWALGANRAAEVAAFLARGLNIPEEKINVVTRGALDPQVPNISAENRARNRRVEVIVLYR